MNKNNKKITIKDYAIVISLFIITGFLIIVLANYYKEYREYYRSIPIISGYVNEIKEEELDNYLTENDNVLVYIAKADDVNSRKLEKTLKIYIKGNNLIDKTIYINLAKVNNEKSFTKELNTRYARLKTVNIYPSFIIIRNKTIIDLVSGNITLDDINNLLESYGMLGD